MSGIGDTGPDDGLGDRLTRHLQSRAAGIPLGHTPVASVIRRGRQRRARKRAAVGALAATVTLVVAVGGIRLLTRPGTVHVGSPTSNVTVPASSVASTTTIGDRTGLTWTPTPADPASVPGRPSIAVPGAPAGPYYAIAPGSSGGGALLWTSLDGISWRPGAPVAANRTLAADATTLASLGADGAGRLTLDVSRDRGATFTSHALTELDLPGIAVLPGVGEVEPRTSVAVGPPGIVAVAVPHVRLDLGAVLEGARAGGSQLRETPGGVLELPADCAVPTSTRGDHCTPIVVPWADLGITEAAVAARFAPPTVWFGSSAETMGAVTLPALPGTVEVTSVAVFAAGDAYALVVHGLDPATLDEHDQLLVSTDGTTWTAATSPFDDVVQVAALPDGSLVARAAQASGDVRIAISHDRGATWSVHAVGQGSDAALHVDALTAGPAGIVVAASSTIDTYATDGPVSVASGSFTVRKTSAADTFTFVDASGAEVGRWDVDHGDHVQRDAGGDLLLVADSGAVALRFTLTDQQALQQQADARAPAVTLLLRSTDGTTWTRSSLSAIAGFDAEVRDLRATTTSVMVVAANRVAGSPKVTVLDGRPAT